MPGFNGSCGSFGQKWRIQQIVLIGHQRDLVVCPPEYALEMQGGLEAAKTSPEDENPSHRPSVSLISDSMSSATRGGQD